MTNPHCAVERCRPILADRDLRSFLSGIDPADCNRQIAIERAAGVTSKSDINRRWR
jgi:hypothetical protein